jgi:DNA-binding beta-propeller fold protein YncE
MEVIMMPRLAASSAWFLRSLLHFVIPLPLILALGQFSSGALYHEEAFLPSGDTYCVDMSPDQSVIYAATTFGSWDHGVTLYDAQTYTSIKGLHPFPDVPKYILASADGAHLYTTAYYQGAVAKIRVSDGAVVKSISVGPWPVGMVFDSARRYLYVMVNCPYCNN